MGIIYVDNIYSMGIIYVDNIYIYIYYMGIIYVVYMYSLTLFPIQGAHFLTNALNHENINKPTHIITHPFQ